MKRVRFSAGELNLVREQDVCRIATIGRDGWPHVVPVGYLYKKGQFYFPVNKKSKKVRNLTANPRTCVVIDDEKEGVLLVQGRMTIAEGKTFQKLKKWMVSKTGWTLSSESEGAILVLTPVKKAGWKKIG